MLGCMCWVKLSFSLRVGLDMLGSSRASEPLPKMLNSSAALQKLKSLRLHGTANVGLVFCTAVAGAFVAGNDAGRAFNTFPKMDGKWIPPTEELFALQPVWRNWFENTALVQFDHRVLAVSTLATVLGFYVRGKRIQ
jgi:cytochrome c oxidase assembly protein subunit 15